MILLRRQISNLKLLDQMNPNVIEITSCYMRKKHVASSMVINVMTIVKKKKSSSHLEALYSRKLNSIILLAYNN